MCWNAEKLTYREAIKTTTIDIASIKRFELRNITIKSRFNKTSGLCLFSESMRDPILIINIKPFARADVSQLVEMLKQVTKL